MCINECLKIQVCMPIYLLDAIYCHVVIGLIHIMEGVLVIHILSIEILATPILFMSSTPTKISTTIIK